MEGVVFALRQGLDLMRSLGVSIDHLVATGGSIRHPLWLRLQADIFHLPVMPADTPQATGFGAALLAGEGVGLFDRNLAMGQIYKAPSSTVINPDPKRAEQYEKAFQMYCKIYPALHSIGPGQDAGS
jgi:xylulokinase